MKKTRFLIKHKFFLSLIFFTSFQFSLLNSLSFWDNVPSATLAKQIVDEMTDTELLSQTFMFGWAGTEPPELLYQWVERGLGSVKVFGWNTDDIHLVAKSITNLQKSSQQNRFQIPLFVATDQEGGWIRHVKGDTSVTPGNMAIGAAGYPSDAWYSGYYICREIKALGINMNFAPTVDLFTNHNSTIIGTRSFGENPENAGILGAAFASGSTAAGVIPTVKHFPGHGDTSLDSHGHLPLIDIDSETLKNRELVPFKYLIKEKIPAVMSGHLAFPKIDPSNTPASLSKYFLTELLRGELGYEGLIITDDMTMVGATIFAGSMSNAFRLALEAGNDIILSSTTAKLNEALWTSNLELMSEDDEFRQTVKKAAYRVIKTKLEYFKSGNSAPLYPDEKTVDDFIPDKDGEKFFLEQACRSITIEKKGDLPLTSENSNKILFLGSLTSYFTSAKKHFPKNSGEFHYTYDCGPNEAQWVLDNLPPIEASYDTIVICVNNENHVKIAQYFKDKNKKVIILSTMSPTLVESLSWADSILLGYSWRCDYSMKAMVGAICGDFDAKGKKPYSLIVK